MPRRRIGQEQATPFNSALTEKLCHALRTQEESGQPLIYERELAPGRFRVVVIWDEWDDTSLEERATTILKAYEIAEGPTYSESIVLASGLTMPEATAAGMLPYQVSTALRKDDPVTLQQCRDAMLAEGASTLFGPDILQLRFATRDEVEACRKRLIARLPGSENVWVVSIEVSVQDHLGLQDAVGAEHR